MSGGVTRFFGIVSIIVFSGLFVHAQLDSIFDQGVYRKFIVHTPVGYNAAHEYPVVSLHSLNSNAAQKESYS